MIYADSSAVVKWYAEEEHSAAVRSWTGGVVVSVLTAEFRADLAGDGDQPDDQRDPGAEPADRSPADTPAFVEVDLDAKTLLIPRLR